MIRYREDENGRLFRWDEGLGEWLRIHSGDDEFEPAAHAIHADQGSPVADPPQLPRRRPRQVSCSRVVRRGGGPVTKVVAGCFSHPQQPGRSGRGR